MTSSTKLEDKLEGIENFEHGNTGLVSFSKRMILISMSKNKCQNLKKLKPRRSIERI